MTPVGSGAAHPSLGFILPATTQGELSSNVVVPRYYRTGAEVAELCRRAEATGADSLWAVDHLYWPHPIAEAFTTLAVAAVATSRPTLGTCVLQLPLRPPSVVAKQATALQLLSGGRFVLGLGVGIHEHEYVRAGVDYHRRGPLMDEGVAGLRGPGPAPSGADYVQEPASAPVPCGSGAPARRPGAGPPPSATAGCPSSSPRTSTGPHWPRSAARRPRPAAIPTPSRPGVVVFACVGDDDEAPAAGAAWLSELYRLPPKAFQRHLVAGSPETCAAALDATPRPAPATFW